MLYLLAILLPPVPMFMAGKPIQASVCLVLMLTIIGWLPAAIWAFMVVHNHYADKRTQRLIDAQRRS